MNLPIVVNRLNYKKFFLLIILLASFLTLGTLVDDAVRPYLVKQVSAATKYDFVGDVRDWDNGSILFGSPDVSVSCIAADGCTGPFWNFDTKWWWNAQAGPGKVIITLTSLPTDYIACQGYLFDYDLGKTIQWGEVSDSGPCSIAFDLPVGDGRRGVGFRVKKSEPPIPPTCALSGPSELLVGETGEYRVEWGDNPTSSQLKVFSSPTNTIQWNNIYEGTSPGTTTFTCPNQGGQFYITCNALDLGLKCSGNPWCEWEPNPPSTLTCATNGWVDCGNQDLITLDCLGPPTPTPTPVSFGPDPGEPEVAICGSFDPDVGICVLPDLEVIDPFVDCECTNPDSGFAACCNTEVACEALCGSPGDTPPQCPGGQTCDKVWSKGSCVGDWKGNDGCSTPEGATGDCCADVDTPPSQCPGEQVCYQADKPDNCTANGTWKGDNGCSDTDGNPGNCCQGDVDCLLPIQECQLDSCQAGWSPVDNAVCESPIFNLVCCEESVVTCDPGYVCSNVANCEEFPEPGISGAANTYPSNCVKSEPGDSPFIPENGNCCIEYVDNPDTDFCQDRAETGWLTDTCTAFLSSFELCYYVECGEQGSPPQDFCAWPPSKCKAGEPPEPSDEDCGTISGIQCVDEDGKDISPYEDCSDLDCNPGDDACRSQLPEGGECCVNYSICSNYTPGGGNKQEIFCDDKGEPTKESTDSKGNPNPISTAIGCIPTDDLNAFTKFLLRWGMGIAGGIAMLLIVYAGFLIKTSQGHPHKLQAGKELMGAAIAGIILIVFGAFLLRLIGIDILQIPGF